MRSALMVPSTFFPRLMGTHKKERWVSSRLLRLAVRLRKLGSSLMRGTTMGSPVSTTFPVMPSPS